MHQRKGGISSLQRSRTTGAVSVAVLLAFINTAAAQQTNPSTTSDTSLDELLSSSTAESHDAGATSTVEAPSNSALNSDASTANSAQSNALETAKSPTQNSSNDSEPQSTVSADVPDDKKPLAKTTISRQIEEIVVTATKREESLRDIPQSITAIDGESLEKSGIQGVEEIVRYSPGVNFYSDGQQGTHITIRGVSSGPATNQTTGTIFGNVSLTDPYLQLVSLDPNPFDLKSVEVLKGPQGTLFGAGGFNGAVRYVPEAPAFGVWESKYFAQYTSIRVGDHEGAPIFGAAANIPIGNKDKWALRLVGIERRDPGYIDDIGAGKNDANTLRQTGLRGALGWKPEAEWDIKLLFVYQTMHSPDTGNTDNPDGRLSRDTTPRKSPTDNKFQLGNFSVNYAFDWATVTSETSLIKKGVHFFQDESRLINPASALSTLGITGLGLDTINNTDIKSQEIRFTSPSDSDSNWKWVAGAFGSKEHYVADIKLPLGDPLLPSQISGLPPLLSSTEQQLSNLLQLAGLPLTVPVVFLPNGQVDAGTIYTDAHVQEFALFADVIRRFGESWELNLGGRLYKTKSGGTSTKGGVLFAGTSNIDETVNEKGFSPKVSLTWHATDDIMSYATVSRGYRVGGIQPGIVTIVAQSEAPTHFKSDQLMSYELGLRTQWLDNSLHLDLTGYFLDWKNPQIRVNSPTDTVSNYFTNVGAVQGKGLELSAQWLPPIDGLSINVGGSYNKTETTKPYSSAGQIIPAGTQFPQSPKWQTVSNIAYAHEFGDWTPSISVTHTYLGKAIGGLVDQSSVFGYQQWDLNLSVFSQSHPLIPTVSLIGTNLLDERGISYRTTTTSSLGAYTDVNYIRPRAVTLRLSGKF